MKSQKYSAFSQVKLLIIVFCLLSTIAAIPVITSARFIVYKIMCNYNKVPPRWSIVRLFNNYAEKFDEHLIHNLEYHTPSYLTEFIQAQASLVSHITRVLDLGCGTGLLGQALTKQFNIEHLIGVDLSSKMLQKSKEKAIYTELYNADLLDYLQSNDDLYDLITATDVFIYIGDLKEVMKMVHKHLEPGGYFAFSVENLPSGTFQLMSTGRFQHSLNYLEVISSEAGFKNIRYKSVALRKEYGVMIHGYIILLEK